VFADAAGALSYRLLDEDEFEVAQQRYAYADGGALPGGGR
jgi:hypothetical protein